MDSGSLWTPSELDQGVRIRDGATPTPLFSRTPSIEPDPLDLPIPFESPFARQAFLRETSELRASVSPTSPSSASSMAASPSGSGSDASTIRPYESAPTPGAYYAPTPGAYSPGSENAANILVSLNHTPSPSYAGGAPTPGIYDAPTPGAYYAPTPGAGSHASTPGVYDAPTPQPYRWSSNPASPDPSPVSFPTSNLRSESRSPDPDAMIE